MEQKSFTEKLINFLMTENLPKEKGDKAVETGLIVAINKNSTPICVSYGSSLDITLALYNIIEQNEPILAVLISTVCTYIAMHPNAPCRDKIKYYMNYN